MADYFSQSVVTPSIPACDMNAAEHLLLTSVFCHQAEDDHVYFFADTWREMHFALPVASMRAALSASSSDCVAARFLAERITGYADEEFIDIDMDDHWMEILQDIVRRSSTLAHIAIETSYSCTRMLADGFGGQAIVITADAIESMSTSQFIEEALGRLVAASGK